MLENKRREKIPSSATKDDDYENDDEDIFCQMVLV